MAKFHVECFFHKPDGSERWEDLGVHEASLGRKAKAKAVYLHAGRMGWKMGKRGPITTAWHFRVHLVPAVGTR